LVRHQEPPALGVPSGPGVLYRSPPDPEKPGPPLKTMPEHRHFPSRITALPKKEPRWKPGLKE
jgi:hypothetical protein